ncbi:uncharacterized protein LOC120350697 [Nilaparvata lugens]|uniref:uncharacterized protein LOC120350697 n=1 Tax=Nilaparvata lugens TaxID=108931 RepID=UPI00193E5133|nr:uncharacterized protein LOC120350697 [Nilaparvata lugens]
MNQVLVWKDIDKLELRYAPDITPPDDFIKLSCTNNYVFLLDKSGTIWYGEVSNGMFLTLNRSDIKAEDIACTSTHLFFITENGRVFRADVNNLNTYEEVILHEDANTCCHGYVTTSQRIAVKHIEAGGMGVLFLSDSGQLWAMGDYPQLDISSVDGPKKVAFFEGRHVISMACGRDFNVVVVHKRDDHCPIGNMDADEAEVFISTCPQCVNENIMSPLSPQSLTDLEIKRKHSNDSVSVSTSTSRNIDSEDKRSDNENTSSSTEGDSVHRVKTKVGSGDLDSDNSDSAEEEKNDRMSRLLMNTEAARQFFTRQLSWMSSGGEELLAEVSGPTKIIKKNVTTMASYVYEGVKTVGDKVATLSRHVSGGSDNNSESFEEFLTDDLNPSSTSSLRCEWSCSGGCSDVSGADRVGAGGEKLALYLSRGARLIKTEVWAWGGAQHGQLGSGDIVPRNKPVIVSSLMHVGAMRVECGWSHCACVTLTGRCALWGRNDLGQICDLTKGSDQSSPHVWGHTSQAVTGARHTLLLAPDSTLHWLGKHRPETLNSNNTELDISEYISDGKYTNDSSSMTTDGESETPVNHNKENNTTVSSITSTKGENNIHVTSIVENNTSVNSLSENNVTVTSKNGENSTTVNCSYSREENNIAVNCVGENNTSVASSGMGNKVPEAKESRAFGVMSSRGESNICVNGASSRGESNTTVNCVTSSMGESDIVVNSRGVSNNCVTSSSKATVNCVTSSRGESNIAVNSRGENNKTVNSRGENNTTVNCVTSARVPIRVLSSGDVSMCIVGRPPMTSDLKLNSDLANEQCFLEEMVSFHSTIVRPLSRRSCIDDIVANLCSRYADLVHLTALNVATLYQGVPSNILLHSHTDEHLLVYERYSLAVCNVIAMSAFHADCATSRDTAATDHLFLGQMMLSRGSSEASGEVQRSGGVREAQDAARKLAEAREVFWESSGRLVDTLGQANYITSLR